MLCRKQRRTDGQIAIYTQMSLAWFAKRQHKKGRVTAGNRRFLSRFLGSMENEFCEEKSPREPRFPSLWSTKDNIKKGGSQGTVGSLVKTLQAILRFGCGNEFQWLSNKECHVGSQN